MPTSDISRNMIHSLVELGELKLAIRVIWCDARTELLAVQSQQLKRKMAKHNARVKKQEDRVDQLAEDIPRIIMAHQKK